MVHPVEDVGWNLVPSPSDMATEVSSFDMPSAGEEGGLAGLATVEAHSMLGVVIGAHPVGGTGPKAGFLYIRVLEAGNLGSLISTPSCCRSSSSSSTGCSSCFFSCSGCNCTSRGTPDLLQVAFSCICFERPVRTKGAAPVDEKAGTATFQEEMLLRALNFCSADQIKVTLESAGTVLAEAMVPMRAALPDVLLACAGSDSQVDEAQLLSSKVWPPRHRAVLRPTGLEDFSAPGVGGVPSQLPYVEFELLQLVDGSLPASLGSKPLLLALENKQEQLVRGYLSFDYVERLSLQEQALCVTAAIQQSPFMLLQLLDQIQPSHEHLLLAIRLGQDHLIEPILQAGGLSLMRSKNQWRRARGGQGRGRPAEDSRSSQRSETGPAEGVPRTRNERQLTPLALAAALGHVGCVQALCQWARRQRLQVDPSGPYVTMLSLGRRDSVATSVWEDLDSATLGDPPMVMAVRGQGELEEKLEIISILCQHNFPVDTRSPADSWTPLLAAVERGSTELVEALVAQGARSSPDSLLGFTPLHLACQMGHWHLIPCLVETMHKQYSSLSAWGPSPQYVSLNVADVYGRTALDIALLRYFNDESQSCGMAAAAEGNGQKAVNVLREFIHRSPPDDPGVVCGWELLQVLNLIDAIPSKKAISAQLADCNRIVEGSPNSANAESQEAIKETAESLSDVKEVLQAIRVLVKAGAQTRFLLEDLLEPAKSPPVASPIFKSAVQPARTSPKYSLEEDEVGVDDDSADESFTS